MSTMTSAQSPAAPGFRPGMSPSDWAPTPGIGRRVVDAAENTKDAFAEMADVFWLFSEQTAQTSDNRLVNASNKYFGPEKTMIGVLVVAVVLYLMPTILSKVGDAGGEPTGPLGNISSGQEAQGIVEFGWLVPLLMIVFMVFTYLRNSQ